MTLQDYGKVEVACIAPHFNKKRYYRISAEARLFGPVLVRVWWWRISWRELRRMVQYFEDNLFDALDTANNLIARKLRKGYEVFGLQ